MTSSPNSPNPPSAPFALIVHGGVFWETAGNNDEKRDFLKEVLTRGFETLRSSGSALDCVTEAVRTMENSAHYIAGKGAGPNSAGYYELDASIMDGASGKAGAVAGLRRFANPVLAARAVMEKTSQVLLGGDGADHALIDLGLPPLDDPRAYFSPADPHAAHPKNPVTQQHGTVGAIALDQKGRIVAATSTGGLTGKPEGRIGDSPIIGAATWADDLIGISTTGEGEYFIRAAAAHDVMARSRYGKLSAPEAAKAVIDAIGQRGGKGGLIALTSQGEITRAFNTPGMHHGWVKADGKIYVSND